MKKVLLECLEREYSNGMYVVRQGEVFAVPEFEAERLMNDFPGSFRKIDEKKEKDVKVELDLWENPPARWKIIYKDVFDEKNKGRKAKEGAVEEEGKHEEVGEG